MGITAQTGEKSTWKKCPCHNLQIPDQQYFPSQLFLLPMMRFLSIPRTWRVIFSIQISEGQFLWKRNGLSCGPATQINSASTTWSIAAGIQHASLDHADFSTGAPLCFCAKLTLKACGWQSGHRQVNVVSPVWGASWGRPPQGLVVEATGRSWWGRWSVSNSQQNSASALCTSSSSSTPKPPVPLLWLPAFIPLCVWARACVCACVCVHACVP